MDDNGDVRTERIERHKIRLIASGWDWLKHRDPRTVALFLLIGVVGPAAAVVGLKELKEERAGYFHALAFDRANCAKQHEDDRAHYSKCREEDRAFIREMVERLEKQLGGK